MRNDKQKEQDEERRMRAMIRKKEIASKEASAVLSVIIAEVCMHSPLLVHNVITTLHCTLMNVVFAGHDRLAVCSCPSHIYILFD